MDPVNAKLSIANSALIKCGAKRIKGFNDGSSNAEIINDLYDSCRDELIEEHPWSFCLQTVPLTQVTLLQPLPVFGDGCSIAYALPADYMALYMVNMFNVVYRVETIKPPYVATPKLVMLCNQPGLIIKYFYNNDDPTTYSAKFSNALACKIALEACFKISEAAQWATKIEANYDRALMSAMTADSKNSIADQSIANEWFLARLAGSGSVVGLPDGNIGFFPDPFNPDS